MRTIKTINTKNQSNPVVYETQQPLTGLIKKMRVHLAKLNLGLSFKLKKRGSLGLKLEELWQLELCTDNTQV